MKNKFNKKLRKRMIEKDMLVYDLAEKTGVTSVQVSRIINFKSKGSMGWWEKAAVALECKIEDIIE